MKAGKFFALLCLFSLTVLILLALEAAVCDRNPANAEIYNWSVNNWIMKPDSNGKDRYVDGDNVYVRYSNGRPGGEFYWVKLDNLHAKDAIGSDLPWSVDFYFRKTSAFTDYDSIKDGNLFADDVGTHYEGTGQLKDYSGAWLEKSRLNLDDSNSDIVYIGVRDIDGTKAPNLFDKTNIKIDGFDPNSPGNLAQNPIAGDGTVIKDGDWNNKVPFVITWEAAAETDGKKDPEKNGVSSGLKGYAVCWRYNINSAPEKYDADGEDLNPLYSLHDSSDRDFQVTPEKLSGDGKYYLFVRSVDNVENCSEAKKIFEYGYDSIKPGTATITNQNNSYENTLSFDVAWRAEDPGAGATGSGIDSYVVESSTDGSTFTPWGTFTDDHGTFNGQNGQSYWFRAKAADKAGNVSNNWSGAVKITVDTAKPSSNVTAPSGALSDLVAKITWYATDSGSEVKEVGIQFRAVTAETGPWQNIGTYLVGQTFYNWPIPAELNNATIEVRSIAIDNAGNTEDAPYNPDYDVRFFVSAGNPPGKPAWKTPPSDTTPRFEWADAYPADGYYVSVDTPPTGLSPYTTNRSYEWLTSLADGEHTFFVSAKRGGGPISGAVGCNFTIDTSNPVISITASSSDGPSVNISGEGSDTVKVSRIEYQVMRGSAVYQNWKNATGSFGTAVAPYSIVESLDDGTFTFRIRAIDGVGNVTTIESGQFLVDIKYPGITFIKPSPSPLDPRLIDPKPSIRALIHDGNGLETVTLSIRGLTNGYLLESVYAPAGAVDYTLSFDSAVELGKGDYEVTISATSEGKMWAESVKVRILAGAVETVTPPISYPNPFTPGKKYGPDNKYVRFKFELSRDSSVKLAIYDSAGKPVKMYLLSSFAGINEVEWDGKDNFGKLVPNGPYYYFVIVNGKVIGKGALAAYK